MGFFIENAEVVVLLDDDHLRIFRRLNLLIEDGYLKCIGKDCVKPRDVRVVDGSRKLILPPLINSFIDPLTIIDKTLSNNNENIQYLIKPFSRFICLKHVLNGLAGFISLNHKIFDYSVCRDLKLHVAYLDKRCCIEGSCRDSDKRMFPYVDLDSDEDLDNLKVISSVDNWIFIKTPLTRRRVFSIKRSTGKWFIELLNTYSLVRERTVLIGLNWVSATDINYILINKPVVLTSPSQSMSMGEHGYLPVRPLLDRGVSLTLFSGDYSLLGFNLYLEYSLFYLLTKFLYGDLDDGYNSVIRSTIATPYAILGLNYNYSPDDSKPSLVVLDTSYRRSWFRNMVLNPFLFFETTVEYLFINGEPVLTPSIRSKLVSELTSITYESFMRDD